MVVYFKVMNAPLWKWPISAHRFETSITAIPKIVREQVCLECQLLVRTPADGLMQLTCVFFCHLPVSAKMPRLVDGILIEDDSSSIASDLPESIAHLNITALDGGNCVEHGSLHSCLVHSKVSVGAKPLEDAGHPRHPDFARRFCKSILTKEETRSLVREVVREAQ